MWIRRLRECGVAFLLAGIAFAQAPPAPPVINPANARADFILEKLGSPGFAIAWGEAAEMLVAGFEDGSLRAWDKAALASPPPSKDPKVVPVVDKAPVLLKAHQGPVLAVAWNGGPVLASAGADKKIIFWTMADKKPAQTLDAGSIVRALAMSPDGKRLASSNDDFSIQLSDVSPAKLGNKLAGHTNWVLALAFSADGKKLASGGIDGVVRIWDVDGAKKVLDIPVAPATKPPPNQPPPPPITIHSVALSADGKLVAAGGADGQVYLYNLADGKLVRAMPGHTSAVSSLVFHPNNTLLISGSKDRSIRLWNLANGQPFKVLDGHTAWVQGVALMNQATRVGSVGADQTVRVWDMAEPAKKK